MYFWYISGQNEKGKSVRCPTAAALQPKLAPDHMKSCRLYSRPGRENYSPGSLYSSIKPQLVRNFTGDVITEAT